MLGGCLIQAIQLTLDVKIGSIDSILKPIGIAFNLPVDNGLECTQSVAVSKSLIALLILKLGDEVNQLVDGDVVFGVLIFHTFSIRESERNFQLILRQSLLEPL